MERVCLWFKVKRELIEEYRQAHENVWPELLEVMRQVGMGNYSLFMRDDGLVVGYFEAENAQDSIQELEATDVSQRWEQSMAHYFEAVPSGLGGGKIEWLEQVFYSS